MVVVVVVVVVVAVVLSFVLLAVEKGALACKGDHWNKVPRAKDWHTPSLVKTIVRLQFVIEPNLFLEDGSDDCKLPNNCDKRQARQLGAMHISKDAHAALIDEIIRRDTLDCDIASDDSSESDSGESTDDSEDGNDD